MFRRIDLKVNGISSAVIYDRGGAGRRRLIMREETHKVPRDNVHFEYRISIGRLGQDRSFLLVQADTKVKLASDLADLTTFRYQGDEKDKMKRSVAKACDVARKRIEFIGVRRIAGLAKIASLHAARCRTRLPCNRWADGVRQRRFRTSANPPIAPGAASPGATHFQPFDAGTF